MIRLLQAFRDLPTSKPQETKMAISPALRPSVMRVLAALEACQALISRQAEALSTKTDRIAELETEMNLLKEMIDGKVPEDTGGSTGGVVG